VSIEAASPFGWERYAGSEGAIIGIDRFGARARSHARVRFTPEHRRDREGGADSTPAKVATPATKPFVMTIKLSI